MNIQIKGTNIELTPSIKSYAEEKIGGLEKFIDDVLEARVELEQSPHHQTGFFRCEVNLDVPKQVLRAESTEVDLYAAIDMTVPKLREQIQSYKDKLRGEDRRLRRYLKSIFAWRPWRQE